MGIENLLQIAILPNADVSEASSEESEEESEDICDIESEEDTMESSSG